MKNLTLPAAMLLASWMTAAVTGYKQQVYESISESDYNKADSLLDSWRDSAPDDQELYPAGFNRYLNEARQSLLTLEGVEGIREDAFVLSDSLGNQVGALGERVEWNDSLYSKAIEVISAGITEYPSRLDFRLGKAAALKYRSEWPSVIETLDGVVEQALDNRIVWTWENGDTLDVDSARMIVRDALFDNIREIYVSDDEMSPVYVDMLGARIISLFADEYRTLNILGGNKYAQGDKAGAIDYFTRSFEANPADGLSLSNIAYIYYNDKDTVRAVEICNKILEDPRIDGESKEIASGLIETINTPLESLRAYDYFFRFLPFVAESVENKKQSGALTDIHYINSVYLVNNRLKSPFSDAQIKATSMGEGCDAVIVWQFPEPDEIPLCLFVAFVPEGETYRLFTIEKSLGDAWVLGSSRDRNHSNYGNIVRPGDAADFVDALRKSGHLPQRK